MWDLLVGILGSGGIITVIAILVINFIKKRKEERRKRRANKIDRLREKIDKTDFSNYPKLFFESSEYTALRPYIKDDAREQIEERHVRTTFSMYDPNDGRKDYKVYEIDPNAKKMLLNEISRIENEWNL